MIRYYQLTPEILLEYIYEGDPKLNEDGIIGNEKDILDGQTSTILLKSNAFNTKYLCFKNESKKVDSFSNFVLPLNNAESQFVVAKSEYQYFYNSLNASNMYSSKNGSGYIYEDTKYDENIKLDIDNGGGDGNDKTAKDKYVKYDKCIVHFTSRNVFGSYDSLIFQAYVYMKNKTKLYFTSLLFKKTSFIELKSSHLLYNEKLYTTQIEFDIPSVFSIFNNDNVIFNNALKEQGVELLENTPIGVNIFGVSDSAKGSDNYIRLKTFKLNTISIPSTYNRLDEINISIYEDTDGDYYCIQPRIGSEYLTFVDYIESMGEDIKAYMVMHELCLREVWVDSDGIEHSEITHKEQHIININENDESEEISQEFNEIINYRPICMKSGENYIATIIDTIKVINTVDSSSYEAIGSINIANPHKYGKKIKHLGVSRPIVNVYNKRVSDEKGTGENGINLSRSGGFVVENNTQNITSFIECTNVGVSILEISPENIN